MQIGPSKIAAHKLDVAQAQATDNLLDNSRCRRGGERNHRRIDDIAQLAKTHVLGAKVVTPGAHTVRLVDGDQCNLAAGNQAFEARLSRPLWRDQQDIEKLGLQSRFHFVLFVLTKM